jgi:hypothetical protein
LFHSKPFVREVVNHLGKDRVLYAHNKDPRAIEDLGIESIRLQGMSDRTKIFVSDDPDIVFINTWIGSYFDKYTGECTLNFNMKMWSDIYDYINNTFNVNLNLGSVNDYLPYVEYSKYDLTNVRTYLDADSKHKIMFCNGPALSGQCEYNGAMEWIINPLAEKNPDKTFITTHKISTSTENVIYTGDIIKSDRCDLNEISYLSKYCSLLIGRNSGPFCYVSTVDNLNDFSKKFYTFGCRESDCFTFGIPKKAKYIFEEYKDHTQLYHSIEKLVNEI